MTIQFAVLDPITGEHSRVETEEDAVNLFVGRVLALALPFWSNTPYMRVETDKDGVEHWTAPDGTVPKNPEAVLTGIAESLASPHPVGTPRIVGGALT